MHWDSLKLLDGLLQTAIKPTVKIHRQQILIPDKLKDVVLKAIHSALTGGHMGV